MNAKKFTVIGLVAIVALFFYLGMNTYTSRVQTAQEVQVKAEQTRLVRFHSPVFGPQNAPVTIVEFFDPACETCRAFYPIVKNLMAQYPKDVRLVIRYAPFHQGSDRVVKLLESSKSQGKYQAVLEAVAGTIAGENTVFVAARDSLTGAELEEQFRHHLEGQR
jgi:protein-disulfide isomerase